MNSICCDLFRIIISFLDVRSLVRASAVCTSWRREIESEREWRWRAVRLYVSAAAEDYREIKVLVISKTNVIRAFRRVLEKPLDFRSKFILSILTEDSWNLFGHFWTMGNDLKMKHVISMRKPLADLMWAIGRHASTSEILEILFGYRMTHRYITLHEWWKKLLFEMIEVLGADTRDLTRAWAKYAEHPWEKKDLKSLRITACLSIVYRLLRDSYNHKDIKVHPLYDQERIQNLKNE